MKNEFAKVTLVTSGLCVALLSADVNANDPEGHNLTFTATGLPNGLTINSSTGLISKDSTS